MSGILTAEKVGLLCTSMIYADHFDEDSKVAMLFHDEALRALVEELAEALLDRTRTEHGDCWECGYDMNDHTSSCVSGALLARAREVMT